MKRPVMFSAHPLFIKAFPPNCFPPAPDADRKYFPVSGLHIYFIESAVIYFQGASEEAAASKDVSLSLLYLLIRGENDFYAWKGKKIRFFAGCKITDSPSPPAGSGAAE